MIPLSSVVVRAASGAEHVSLRSLLKCASLVIGTACIALGPESAFAQEPVQEKELEQAPAKSARPAKESKPIPFHLSLGSGVFIPWSGDAGFNVSGSAHVGLGSDRFWVGGELEYRRFESRLKTDFRPDTNSFALRFSFQYHPFPRAIVSPYAGISVGLMLHKVDDNHSRVDPNDKLRSDVSGGFTMLGVGGVEVPLGTQRLHLFAEGRLGNSSDLWKRKGGNWQTDQVDGITAMGGLRFSF